MSPSSFWDYSLYEIYDLLESHNRKMKYESDKATAELKAKAILDSVLAREIGEYVASMLDKNAKITPVTELLPELFKEENEINRANKEKAEMELYKAKMEEFAFRHNFKMKGGN